MGRAPPAYVLCTHEETNDSVQTVRDIIVESNVSQLRFRTGVVGTGDLKGARPFSPRGT